MTTKTAEQLANKLRTSIVPSENLVEDVEISTVAELYATLRYAKKQKHSQYVLLENEDGRVIPVISSAFPPYVRSNAQSAADKEVALMNTRNRLRAKLEAKKAGK